METPELKPCPFCGSGKVKRSPHLKTTSIFIACLDCEAFGPSGDSVSQAVEFWNTRAEVKAEEKGAEGR